MTSLQIPNITLAGGTKIPQLGVGTYQIVPEDTERVVSEAFEAGYRHIDTASFYHNEAGVGAAVAASGLPRGELFITTKLWNSDQTRAAAAFEESLNRLSLDRVDLFLIHWPQPMFGDALAAWRALIDIAESGRASAIGVSNFEISDLQQLIDETGIAPAINQIEVHPFHQRRELSAYCVEHGIAVEAWGPLARGRTDLLERSDVRAVARAHDRTPAQVVLRWHVQHDRIIFPKTTHRERLIENARLFDFALTGDEMAVLDALEEGKNLGPDPRTFDVR